MKVPNNISVSELFSGYSVAGLIKETMNFTLLREKSENPDSWYFISISSFYSVLWHMYVHTSNKVPAVLISQHNASSSPPPRAAPSKAAMVGMGSSDSSMLSFWREETNLATSGWLILARSLRSAPRADKNTIKKNCLNVWNSLCHFHHFWCADNITSLISADTLETLQTHSALNDHKMTFIQSHQSIIRFLLHHPTTAELMALHILNHYEKRWVFNNV